jgi:hypothetical protein
VGGTRGREALDRLRNVVGRVESSWRPASAAEGFEIVRRRLFQPLSDPAQFKDRDVVARAFADFYRAQHAEFPPECRESGYEQRIKMAYPIHPEVFDRLYTDWSTRLVVMSIAHPYSKDDNSPAHVAAKAILETRGNTPRLYRNTLVFLAADKTRLQDLDEAARKVLAWQSILDEQKNLNLSPYQVAQAETQRTAADSAVTARLP